MLLAQMGDWDGRHDGGHGWGWVVMVLLIVLIVAVTVLLVRHFGDGGRRSVRGAEDVLADRFARGEIDEEEYRTRRDALRS
jgi:putative membrane protein